MALAAILIEIVLHSRLRPLVLVMALGAIFTYIRLMRTLMAI